MVSQKDAIRINTNRTENLTLLGGQQSLKQNPLDKFFGEGTIKEQMKAEEEYAKRLEEYRKNVEAFNREVGRLEQEGKNLQQQKGVMQTQPARVIQYNELGKLIEAEAQKLQALAPDTSGILRYNSQIEALQRESDLLAQRADRLDTSDKRSVDSFNNDARDFNRRLEMIQAKSGDVEASIRNIDDYNDKVKQFNEKLKDYEGQRPEVDLAIAKIDAYNKQIEKFNEKIAKTKTPIEPVKPKTGAITPAVYGVKEEWKKALSAKDTLQKIKNSAGLLAEYIVPGVWLKNWDKMNNWQRGLNIALDLAVIIPAARLAASGARWIAKPSSRATLKLYGQVKNLAVKSRKANEAYAIAVKQGFKKGLPTSAQASKIQKLQQAAFVADEKFLDKFGRLTSVSIKQIKKIERKSGFKGLTKQMERIYKNVDEVKDLTKKINLIEKLPQKKMTETLRRRRSDLFFERERLNAQLKKQYAILDKKMRTRVKGEYYKDMPEAFKGYDFSFENIKSPPSELGSTIDDIERYLKTDESLKPTERKFWELDRTPKGEGGGVATETKTATEKVTKEAADKGTETLKIKAKYKKNEKAKPKEKPAPSEVAKKSTGELTEREKAALYGASTSPAFKEFIADAISPYARPDISQKIVTLTELSPAVKEKVKAGAVATPDIVKAVEAATIEATKAAQKVFNKEGATIKPVISIIPEATTKARDAIKEAIKAETNPLVKQELQTKAKMIEKVAVEISTKPPKIKPTEFKPRIVPRTKKSQKSDKQVRDEVNDREGAIAWRQGELNKKDVWHVIVSPYKTEGDHYVMLGRQPSGATIVKGAQSAFKTAKTLYGISPSRQLRLSLGFMKVSISPTGKGIQLEYKPEMSRKKKFPLTRR